jgi:hypothetical protein
MPRIHKLSLEASVKFNEEFRNSTCDKYYLGFRQGFRDALNYALKQVLRGFKEAPDYPTFYVHPDHDSVLRLTQNGDDVKLVSIATQITGGYASFGVKGVQKGIHIQKLKAFKPNKSNDGRTTANHIDGNKLNNHISNLEWVTRSENTKHAYKLGLMRQKKGPTHL